MDSKTLQEAALSLPPDERAALAEKLLSSLDEPSEAELERIWFRRRPAEPANSTAGMCKGFPKRMCGGRRGRSCGDDPVPSRGGSGGQA